MFFLQKIPQQRLKSVHVAVVDIERKHVKPLRFCYRGGEGVTVRRARGFLLEEPVQFDFAPGGPKPAQERGGEEAVIPAVEDVALQLLRKVAEGRRRLPGNLVPLQRPDEKIKEFFQLPENQGADTKLR